MDCTCPEPFFGTRCENRVKCPYCLRNECDLNGICKKCKVGWIGKTCEIRTCESLDICNGNGEYLYLII